MQRDVAQVPRSEFSRETVKMCPRQLDSDKNQDESQIPCRELTETNGD